ncbi:DUF4097 family beta strand repeat-containing protein [Clostridium sp. AWRP]|uniref:DUF4097 family beta strand repeat-containing protein n=1 Tax=Clostridium sp. AWRP TaxID=2212991 RepID=UPI000FDB4D1B|nr:DUF4097 family beta strand repeat-containing protein [Clostridium sp. AWRP]AZV57805.1 DUF4097 domain-containing protein [Clostridium sp. AWRP]
MIKKVLLIFVAILAVAGGILFFSPAKAEDSQRIFTSKEISNLEEISLNGDFDVNITSSDSRDIQCSFSKLKKGFVFGTYNFEANIENNVLNVTSDSKIGTFCIGGCENLRLNIDIPKSYKNKLYIKSKLSKVNILNSNSKDIQCDVHDSNIKISLDNICGNITVNSNLGNINLKLPKDEKFNLSAKSHMGEVTNNLASNVDHSLKEKNINLSSSDGNITISGS